jgi:hypothetical protein
LLLAQGVITLAGAMVLTAFPTATPSMVGITLTAAGCLAVLTGNEPLR